MDKSPRLVSIRRYPVKSMGGEYLDAAEFDARGLVGDRWYAVVDGDGKFASGKNTRRFRRRDAVFEYRAVTGNDGVRVLGPDGEWAADDPDLAAALSRDLGDPVRLLPEGQISHQDAGAVSLVGTATLAWVARRWGGDPDPRRFRVNLVIETTEPFEEESWGGRRIEVGGAELAVTERVERCRTIDVDQDGARVTNDWLKPLGGERDSCLAVYADVTRPGAVNVGDALTFRST